jgi:hypothetical protein
MRRHSLFAVVVLGCSPNEANPTDAGSDADAHGTHDVAQVDVYDEPTPICRVSGTVTDFQDAPWAGARLQVCSTALCTLGTAAGDGTFTVGVSCNASYHVLARPPVGDTRYTSDGIGVIPNTVTMDVALTTPVRIPQTGTPIALTGGSQTVSVATDLKLTINPSDLAFSGTAQIAGVLIDNTKWPPFIFPGDAGTKTVLAMWALLPFGTTTNAGKTVALTVDNTTFALTTGTSVSFYQVNETTAELMPNPSTGVVQANGTITGGTVTRITWIVMTL